MADTDLTRTQFSPIEDIIGDMTSCQLAAIMEELCNNGTALWDITRTDRIAGLVQTVRSLYNEHANILQRMIVETSGQSGWSQEMCRFVLDDFFSLISAESLNALLDHELGDETTEGAFVAHPRSATKQMLVPPTVVLHILGSTVPTTSIEALIFSLAAGVPCVVRTSQHETAAARFFMDALRREAPSLAKHAAVVTWPSDDSKFIQRIDALKPTIVFHGSDASIQQFERQLQSPLTVHRYGHRFSFGVIAPPQRLTDAHIRQLTRQVAWDATLFEGRGCMSMQSLFILPPPAQPTLACDIARLLTEEGFPLLQKQFPRMPLPATIAAEHMQQKGVAAFSGEVWSNDAGTALCWKDAQLRSSPGYRHIHLSTVQSVEELLEILEPFQEQLSTASLSCAPSQRLHLATLLGQMGVRRICPLGRMQRPLLLSGHDGRMKIRPWFQLCDLEGQGE